MSQSSVGLLFPGEGSHTADMREDVERVCPDLVERAARALGSDPFERVEEGTRFVQPAIYCASIACFTRWVFRHQGAALTPPLMAGRSVGEISALAAAGSLSVEAGLDLVVLRGRLMADAERRPPGGLAAMERALPHFEAALDAIELRPPEVPVISCVTAEPFDDIRRRLAEALTSPVRWREVLFAMRARGVSRFVELGPGQVLTRPVRRDSWGVHAPSADRLEPTLA